MEDVFLSEGPSLEAPLYAVLWNHVTWPYACVHYEDMCTGLQEREEELKEHQMKIIRFVW